jgi:hypothetical protein
VLYHKVAYLMLCTKHVVVRKKERMSQVSHYHWHFQYGNSASSVTRTLTLKIFLGDQYVRHCMVVAAEDSTCPRPDPVAIPPPILSSMRFALTGRAASLDAPALLFKSSYGIVTLSSGCPANSYRTTPIPTQS